MLFLLITYFIFVSGIMGSKLPLLEMRKIKASKKDDGVESSACPNSAANEAVAVTIPDTALSTFPSNKRNEPSIDPSSAAVTPKPAPKKVKPNAPKAKDTLYKKKKKAKTSPHRRWFDRPLETENETLWSLSFNEGEFIDEHLICEADISMIEVQGAESTFQAMEAYNLRSAALARLAEEEKKDVVR